MAERDLERTGGFGRPRRDAVGPAPGGALPLDLVLTPVGRNPIRLADETVRAVAASPLPAPHCHSGAGRGRLASIVIVTHNGLLFTRMCLASLLAHTGGADYEIIIVDNGSTDGTADFLREVARGAPRLRLALNPRNRGFAAASNQGLGMAGADLLVLLNNDTIVPPGWLEGLVRRLEDPAVGLVGPVTNRAGNEARIEASYRTFGEMLDFAAGRARTHAGVTSPIPMLTMFCLALSRATFDRLGPLDERFEVGLFEDDDFSLRAHAAGFGVVCAEDVFVHHFGGASFGELTSTGQAGAIFRANRRRFEEKWGIAWKPHGRRPDLEYLGLSGRVREVVRESVPAGSTAIVISRGDEELLDLGLRRAWHFPVEEDGTYAGYYPVDSDDAIARLERLRERGGEYLVIPHQALWWLDHYAGFRRYLETRCRLVARREGACLVFGLPSGDGRPERAEPGPHDRADLSTSRVGTSCGGEHFGSS